MSPAQIALVALITLVVVSLSNHLLEDVVARTQTTVDQAQEDQP